MTRNDPAARTVRATARVCLQAASCILHFALLTACRSTPTPVQVSQSSAGAYEAALVTDADGLAVAWYDTRDGNAEIYLRLLDSTGHPSSPERRLTETPDASYEASLERLGDSFLAAWYEQTTVGQQTAMLGAWTRDGTRKWTHAIATGSRNPVIRTAGHAVVAAWIQAEDDGTENVWVGSWGEDGTEQRPRTRVGPASKTTWNLNLDLNGSEAWVAFDAATSTRSSELFVARVDPSGVRLERVTRDDGAMSEYPDVALDGQGRVALTRYDMRDGNDEIYLFVGRVSDLRGDLDDRAGASRRRRGNRSGRTSPGTPDAWD